MSALSIKAQLDIAAPLVQPRYFKQMTNSMLNRVSLVGEREYKKEAPVDKGDLRRGVVRRKVDMGGERSYIITTIATANGRFYPLFVHEGTGIYRGVPGDWPSTGRVRAGTTRPGIGGIRPNRFVTRAVETVNKEVPKIIEPVIKRYINKKVKKTVGK